MMMMMMMMIFTTQLRHENAHRNQWKYANRWFLGPVDGYKYNKYKGKAAPSPDASG